MSLGPWFYRQFGYERFAVLDERGAEIAEVVHHKHAELIAAAPDVLDLIEPTEENAQALADEYQRIYNQPAIQWLARQFLVALASLVSRRERDKERAEAPQPHAEKEE